MRMIALVRLLKMSPVGSQRRQQPIEVVECLLGSRRVLPVRDQTSEIMDLDEPMRLAVDDQAGEDDKTTLPIFSLD